MLVFAALFFIALGGYLLVGSFKRLKSAMASESWPSATGRLLNIRLWGKRLIDGTMQDAEKLGVAYEYEIRGITYKGCDISFYTLMYPETLQYAKKFQEMENVPVYYNPENPEESVLITGPRKSKPYSDTILALIAVMLGIILLFVNLYNQ